MPLKIEDYALIGDCHTAALVGRDGSIDWLCLPRFDAGACFAALLGTEQNGRWKIAPRGQAKITRRYRPGTLILETDFETEEGRVRLIDFMPPRQEEPDLARLVVGLEGRVTMNLELLIRFDYGSIVPWVQKIDGGLRAIGGPDTLVLRTPVALRGENLTTVSEFTVQAGEEVPFVLAWVRSHRLEPPPLDARAALIDTQAWWEAWSARCTYQGPWKEAVLRSLITLKALTYEPSGGIVAAATTSLPEFLGGVRNWDYRYCWLRDATLTLYSLLNNGYLEEATDWREWLLRAVAGNPEQINLMYGIEGQRRLTEVELPWLKGYEGSAPVRVGNAAHEQFQLDVFGEVMDSMFLARQAGLRCDLNVWSLQAHLVHFVEEHWREPDEGIWEVRGPRRHFTHSKVMAWVALDRQVRMAEMEGGHELLDRWRTVRQEIHDDICRKGFHAGRNTFVQSYDSDEVDASLLMLPLVGFLPADDPRMQGTLRAIEADLKQGDFILRYRPQTSLDGLPPGEGAFLACSFWFVDNLQLAGRHDDAEALFERLLGLRNDVGLLSEEFDEHAGRLVGNFPQAFSHVGLVNTAANLSHAGPTQHRVKQTSAP